MGWEKDLPPGEELVACFRPFLEHLVGSDLSPNTIQKHVDNVWLLGGEIIRDLNQDPSLRKLPADRLLHRVIGDDGGPLIHNGSEEEQNSFDSTCRRLHRFLTPHSARLRRGKRGRKLAWVIGNPGHNPARVTHRFPRPSGFEEASLVPSMALRSQEESERLNELYLERMVGQPGS